MRLSLRADDIAPENNLRTYWDVLLRVNATFVVECDGRPVYREELFPIMELAVEMRKWLAFDEPSDFIYTSVESEAEGMVSFVKKPLDTWNLQFQSPDCDIHRAELPLQVDTAELRRACFDFIGVITSGLRGKVDLHLVFPSSGGSEPFR